MDVEGMKSSVRRKAKSDYNSNFQINFPPKNYFILIGLRLNVCDWVTDISDHQVEFYKLDTMYYSVYFIEYCL